MLNLWMCEHPACDSRAVGEGGAIGLRALGWQFAPGEPLLCPAHRTDGAEKVYRFMDCDREDCPACVGEGEARLFQAHIARVLWSRGKLTDGQLETLRGYLNLPAPGGVDDPLCEEAR